jgi:DNA-binding transcriptional regulator GbsR (MarR family)
LYDCKPATAAEIAQHLQADEKEVLALLRELKGKRLARDRRSKGERLWEPWS